MDPWKRRFLLETIISRFHVNFWGCTLPETNHFAPEKWMVGRWSFPFGMAEPDRCELLVSGRVYFFNLYQYIDLNFGKFFRGSLVGTGAPRECYCEVRWWKAHSSLLAVISARIKQHPSKANSKIGKIIYCLVFSLCMFLFGYLPALDLWFPFWWIFVQRWVQRWLTGNCGSPRAAG